MTESAGGRRVLQIGRGYAQRLGELSNGCQLQRLAGFAAVDTHNADTPACWRAQLAAARAGSASSAREGVSTVAAPAIGWPPIVSGW